MATQDAAIVTNEDYLQHCLRLHGEVAAWRYGKAQRLDELECHVSTMLADGDELWDVIHAIHSHDAFRADMFGFLPDEIEAELKEGDWYQRWQTLSGHELIERLFKTFRQIEPVSMVLRFIRPTTCGIMSAPVAAILGVRPRRKATATYEAYLETLGEVAEQRGFTRAADVEMALWALQVGGLEGKFLPSQQRDALERCYRNDALLQQLQTRNLIVHLFSEKNKLDLAESLLATNVELAGQIAGIEFEQLVGKRFSSPGNAASDDSLEEIINLAERPDAPRLHKARKIRNQAIHKPKAVKRSDVERLIRTARWVKSSPRRSK